MLPHKYVVTDADDLIKKIWEKYHHKIKGVMTLIEETNAMGETKTRKVVDSSVVDFNMENCSHHIVINDLVAKQSFPFGTLAETHLLKWHNSSKEKSLLIKHEDRIELKIYPYGSKFLKEDYVAMQSKKAKDKSKAPTHQSVKDIEQRLYAKLSPNWEGKNPVAWFALANSVSKKDAAEIDRVIEEMQFPPEWCAHWFNVSTTMQPRSNDMEKLLATNRTAIAFLAVIEEELTKSYEACITGIKNKRLLLAAMNLSLEESAASQVNASSVGNMADIDHM